MRGAERQKLTGIWEELCALNYSYGACFTSAVTEKRCAGICLCWCGTRISKFVK